MSTRTALVTGAASGIGLATAGRLGGSGWQVVGVDRTDGPGVAHQVDVHDTEALRGSVVLVSSVLGLTGGGGPFRSTAYITSKGALVALTKALAAQGCEVGIRANCVAPGLVATPFAGRALTDDAVGRYVASRQLLTGGPIEPASVAATIAFLCSADADAITGQVLAVDAGWRLDPRAEADR